MAKIQRRNEVERLLEGPQTEEAKLREQKLINDILGIPNDE